MSTPISTPPDTGDAVPPSSPPLIRSAEEQEAIDRSNTQYRHFLINSTAEERMSKLREPQSVAHWVYGFIFDHMLACILSDQASDSLDLLEAASSGFKKLVAMESPESLVTTDEEGERVVKLHGFPMCSAYYLFRRYESAAAFLRTQKALSHTISHDGPEDCSICYETMQEDTSDTDWHNAHQEALFPPSLAHVDPEILHLIHGFWDESFNPKPPPWKFLEATYCVRDMDKLDDLTREQRVTAIQRLEAIYDYFDETFTLQREGKQAKVNEMKALEPEKFIVELECKHKFHRKCIRRWFTTEGKCPYCRFDVARYESTRLSILEDALVLDSAVEAHMDELFRLRDTTSLSLVEIMRQWIDETHSMIQDVNEGRSADSIDLRARRRIMRLMVAANEARRNRELQLGRNGELQLRARLEEGGSS